MASCVTAITIYAYPTSASTTKTGYSVPYFTATPTQPPCASNMMVMGTAEYNMLMQANTDNQTQATTLTTQAGQISTLNTQVATSGTVASDVAALKTQMTGVLAGAVQANIGSAPNADIIQAEMVIFVATLTMLCIVYGLKRVWRTFDTEGAGHE